jgi:hypothetical protein
VVSLGFDADGKRLRRKVSGQTKAEDKDKLKALHSELDAGLRTAQGYTVEKAVADWLDEGLPGRTAKTVEANRARCGRCWRSSGGSAEGPDGAGRADGTEEDGGDALDPDAAEGP